MTVRAWPTFAGALILSVALTPQAFAAKAKAKEAPIEVAYDFPVYDQVIDVKTAALRSALSGAGSEGTFLQKRDAAGVAAYYAEPGLHPDLDGRRTSDGAGRKADRARPPGR